MKLSKELIRMSGRYAKSVFLATVAALTPALANQPAGSWATSDIGRLFPTPRTGWRIEPLEVTELETPTKGYEAFAATGERVKLSASRTYIASGKRYRITIETENIEAVARIEAISSGIAADPVLRTSLQSAGVSVLAFESHDGIALQSSSEAQRAIKIGTAGIVLLDCAYSGCAVDLDTAITDLDLRLIERFIMFEHRRGTTNDIEGDKK